MTRNAFRQLSVLLGMKKFGGKEEVITSIYACVV